MQTEIKFRKATIVPVSEASSLLKLDGPLDIANSLTFENAEGLLKPEMFDVWRDMVSKRERDHLATVRFAFVHRFESTEYVGREEALSDDYAYKVFLCLRVIKPTKAVFQRIQVRWLDAEKIEVFGFQLPEVWPNVPDAEVINEINLSDLKHLRRLLPIFLKVALNGPENIRHAIRAFNVGYTELRDPTTQIVLWMMGVEALFSDGGALPLSSKELLVRLNDSVGLETDIYDSSTMRQYIGAKSYKVGELFHDLVTLRNSLVHGASIPTEWKEMDGRHGLISAVPYADVLREAASFILRKGILSYLEHNTGTDSLQ